MQSFRVNFASFICNCWTTVGTMPYLTRSYCSSAIPSMGLECDICLAEMLMARLKGV